MPSGKQSCGDTESFCCFVMQIYVGEEMCFERKICSIKRSTWCQDFKMSYITKDDMHYYIPKIYWFELDHSAMCGRSNGSV